MILFDKSGDLFNQAAHFMATFPVIRIAEPILAIGFILHMLYAVVLTIHNFYTRPVAYNNQKLGHSSSWSSRNMFVLGVVIFAFLAIHIANFFWKMKVTGHDLLAEVTVNGVHMENAYALVTGFFIEWWWIVIVYVIGSIALGFHLYHAIWSAFQTLGWSNGLWRRRLNVIGLILSVVIAFGFALIPLWVKIGSL
jgi:succinate dehydrogenase / fumarate reductase cytochrome b subunit